MTRMTGERGSALAELLIAVLLFSTMLSAMAGIHAAVVQNRSRSFARTWLDNDATLLRHAQVRVLAGASHVSYPTTGNVSAALTAWLNVDPSDGKSPIVPGEARRFSHLCVAEGNAAVYLYEGDYPMPNISCGAPGPSGATRIAVAGKGASQFNLSIFRPESNLLLVTNEVKGNAGDLTLRTQFNLRNAKQ